MSNTRNNFGALGTAVNNTFVNNAAKAATNGANAVSNTFTNGANAVSNTFTNGANAVGATVSNGMNAVGTTVSNGMNAVGATVSNGMNAVGTTVSNGMNAVGTTVANGANAVGTTFTNAANSLGKTFATTANAVGTTAQAVGETGANIVNNVFGSANVSNTNTSSMFNASNKNTTSMMPSMISSELLWPVGIFVVLVATFALLFTFFTNEIKSGYDNLSKAVQTTFGTLSVMPSVAPPTPVTPPTPEVHAPSQGQSILERVLPLNRTPEVFNVNKNDFTYYDAEPLCKALGAELATYDQVKDAYGKGADWCNYGWVKGQVAIYPTQKATWDEIQKGDDSERDACGKPGVNGGYFDNPEMKFGVNCYGPKPSQTEHDEAELMKQGRIPMTTSALKTDQKVKEFEAQASSLGVLPFNKNNWQSN